MSHPPRAAQGVSQLLLCAWNASRLPSVLVRTRKSTKPFETARRAGLALRDPSRRPRSSPGALSISMAWPHAVVRLTTVRNGPPSRERSEARGRRSDCAGPGRPPVAVSNGFVLFRVLTRTEGSRDAFQAQKEQLRDSLRGREADRLIRAYLQQVRTPRRSRSTSPCSPPSCRSGKRQRS